MGEAIPSQERGDEALSGPPAFRLGTVEVFPGTGHIRGPGGTRQLDPKVMEVLLRLVAADGDVVSRETLFADVWGKTIVTDFALSRCIYQLRQNVGQVAASDDSPVQTLPKRGYRLAWPVSPGSAERRMPRHPRTLYLGIAVAVAAVLLAAAIWWSRTTSGTPAHRDAIAVMPFDDLTPAGSLAYFGDGVATGLIMELGHFNEIDVIARTSSFYFRDRKVSLAEITAALDIGYLVEGTVNGEGDSIRVAAVLVDARNGHRIWSDTFDGVTGQPFTAQTEIAAEIAGYLELALGNPRKYGGTTNFEAYKAYLRATHAVDTVRDDGLGDMYLNQALAFDPNYAHALEAKAFFIYLRLWQGDGVVEQAWSEARPLLERALQITDQSSLSHVLIAGFNMFRGRYEAAEASLQQALKVNPSDDFALVHLSRLMERTGRMKEAVTLAERNARLDPLNPFRHIQLANRRWTAGDIEGGKASFERAIAIDPLNYSGWRDYCLRLSNREGELAAFRLMARLQKNPDFRAQFRGPTPQLAPTGIGVVARLLGKIGDHKRELGLLRLQARLGDSAELHRELASSLLASRAWGDAWEEAWRAVDGSPQNDYANLLLVRIAIWAGFDTDRVLSHFRRSWPGLFETPPRTDGVEELVTLSAALLLNARNEREQANLLLQSLLAGQRTSTEVRAIALAHLGDTAAAVEALQRHVSDGGRLDYAPADPLWEPLATEPHFVAMAEAESARDALARDEIGRMIGRGELVLPGQR